MGIAYKSMHDQCCIYNVPICCKSNNKKNCRVLKMYFEVKKLRKLTGNAQNVQKKIVKNKKTVFIATYILVIKR